MDRLFLGDPRLCTNSNTPNYQRLEVPKMRPQGAVLRDGNWGYYRRTPIHVLLQDGHPKERECETVVGGITDLLWT